MELVPQLPVGSLHIQRGYLNTQESGGDTVHCSKVSVGSRVTEKPNRQKAGTYEVSNEPSGLGHSTNFPGYILLLTPVRTRPSLRGGDGDAKHLCALTTAG